MRPSRFTWPTGRRTSTIVPVPSVERMRMAPPCSSVERFGDGEAEARALVALGELALDLLERPAELVQRVLRDADAGVRRWRSRTQPADARARTVMRPPSGVNFTALDSRLSMICLSSRAVGRARAMSVRDVGGER